MADTLYYGKATYFYFYNSSSIGSDNRTYSSVKNLVFKFFNITEAETRSAGLEEKLEGAD